MKTILFTSLCIALFSFNCEARDDKNMYDAHAAIERGLNEGILDGSVSFYFGDSEHPEVLEKMGSVQSNKKTNAFNKTDAEACEWAFLGAMKALQARAKQAGANAVINIKSNYRNKEVSDNNLFECGAGSLMAGTAVKGTLAKIR